MKLAIQKLKAVKNHFSYNSQQEPWLEDILAKDMLVLAMDVVTRGPFVSAVIANSVADLRKVQLGKIAEWDIFGQHWQYVALPSSWVRAGPDPGTGQVAPRIQKVFHCIHMAS